MYIRLVLFGLGPKKNNQYQPLPSKKKLRVAIIFIFYSCERIQCIQINTFIYKSAYKNFYILSYFFLYSGADSKAPEYKKKN